MKHSWWFSLDEAVWSIFIRLSLAGVFILAGLQKLTHADILGTDRFTRIGIPWPEFFGPLVGWIELIAGIPFLPRRANGSRRRLATVFWKPAF